MKTISRTTGNPAGRIIGMALSLLSILVTSLVYSPAPAQADITVTVAGPAGSRSQTVPDTGGPFSFKRNIVNGVVTDTTLPLTRNALNTITVSAMDASGNKVSQDIKVTQLSLDQIVVSQVSAERLSVQQIKQLVADGVIKLDNPANYNVSKFDIVLTIGEKQVPISVPVVSLINSKEVIVIPVGSTGGGGGGGGAPPSPPPDVVIFEQQVGGGGEGGLPPVHISGVIIIEGNIKSLKEFYTVRLLLMNTSGIFTLKNVTSSVAFPDGGLSSIAPADGVISFGDILPGDGGLPGQAERQFIIRGDTIGINRVRVNFGGTVGGPLIPDDQLIPFNGSADTKVEVKGPPTFKVVVTHPDSVTINVPYELKVDITDTGDIEALYTSLALDVGGAAELVRCEPGTPPVCTPIIGSDVRSFGDILPGQMVSATFTINPFQSGPITSCLGISDQNIALQVQVGNIGCLVGQFAPERGVPDGVPTVQVAPAPNLQGVSVQSPVTAFFSQLMSEGSISTGIGGTFNVYDASNNIVPGKLIFITLVGAGKTVAVWQAWDANYQQYIPLASNASYTVQITQGITNLTGTAIFNSWISHFSTTGTGADDSTPPVLNLGVEPPVNPSYVLPGQLVKIDAYASDQGSGVVRVELRSKDLTAGDGAYQFIDRRVVFKGDKPPFIFTIDSGKLIPGHTYQFLGTAYDFMTNSQDATLNLIIASSANPPTIMLPTPPALGVAQGISVSLTPDAVTGGVTGVSYYLDGAAAPFKTVNLPPYQAGRGTLDLTLAPHTIRAVAVDALGQTGEASYTFNVVSNPNKPQISLSGAVNGATYIVGSSFIVSGYATDPLGIKSLSYFLDGSLIATGSQPFSIATAGLPTGAHTLSAQAVNMLDVVSDPLTSSFTVVALPSGPAPAAPVIATVSLPVSGQVSVTGSSAPGARLDITNSTQKYGITVNANGSGNFSASIAAVSGDLLSFVAYDYSTSQLSSPAATRYVPVAPNLTSISASPLTLNFTSASASQNITVTGNYDNGSTANLTLQSTFSSNDPSIVTVSASGQVAALKSGSATITVISGGQQTQVTVTVSIVTLTSISATPVTTTFVYQGETRQLVVTANYSDGSKSQLVSGVTFSSGNVAVASVTTGGLITASGNGSTQITAYYPGVQPFPVTTTVNTALDTPPQVQIVTPATGAGHQRGDLIHVTVRGTDAVGGVSSITLTAADQGGGFFTETRQIIPVSLDVSADFSFTVPDSLGIGTSFSITADAQDTGHHSAPTATITQHIVDTTAPSVTITAPATQTPYNYGDKITLTVHATDRVGVTRFRYVTSGAFITSDSLDVTSATIADATFTITVPFGTPSPALGIVVYASDASGNEASTAPLSVIITGADIIPPATQVTAVANPGSSTSTTVTYLVTDGLADLDHVELYFRRNGIGTFNRYLNPDPGYPTEGKYLPQSGATGTITFDSTKMGGDGSYAFYSVGVDKAGNRELAPRDTGTGLVVPDQAVTFNAGTNWTIIASPTTVAEGNTVYDNQNIRVTGTTFTLNGLHSFKNLELLGGAVLTHSPATDVATFKLNLDLWTLTLDATSRIDLVGRGYRGGRNGINNDPGLTSGNQPGSQFGAGGSHGGLGSVYNNSGIPAAVYDDFTNPTDLGSGGGNWTTSAGGAGGGVLILHAINVVNDNTIRVDGALCAASAAGDGGGGSVNITSATLSGIGTIEAKGGGSGAGTGGGGGRIAVNYLDLSTLNQAGISVDGGQGNYGARASNGTIFLKLQSQGSGELVVDGQSGSTAWTTLSIPSGYTFTNITLRNSARVVTDSPIKVVGRLLLTGNSILTHSQGIVSGLAIDAASVQIDAGSAIDVTGRGYSGGSANYGLTLGGITGSQTGAGGSYGGKGGGYQSVDSGLVYGDPRNPVSLGSGGGSWSGTSYVGGAGGGLVTIHATTSLVVDGAIRANGGLASSAAGDGSGGSVMIRASRLAGNGSISADGGGSGAGVGGGGGRVALYCDYLDSAAPLGNLLNVSAFAGHGNYDTRQASAGTVYVKYNQGQEELFIDDNSSGATAAMNTPLTTFGSGTSGPVTNDTLTTDGQMPILPGGLAGLRLNPAISQPQTFAISGNSANTISVVTPNENGIAFGALAAAGKVYGGFYRYDNLTFRRGGNLLLGDRLEVPGTLTMAEHALLSHYSATDNFTSGLYLTLGTLNIDSTSKIDVTGRGYRGGSSSISNDPGKTAGNASGSNAGAGGSHGGLGSFYSTGLPNPLYDSLTNPVDLGSGGGSWGGTGGGAGGGRVFITAGSIALDGAIVANGAASYSAAGDGSGGTININTGSLTGGGAIRVDGGGSGSGTGGGGGRIAILHSGVFSISPELISTLGGQGNYGLRGGIGTFFVKDVIQNNGALIIDGGNFDVPNDSSAIPGALTFDSIVLRNHARATIDGGLNVTGQLLVTGNSILTHSAGNEAGLTINARDVRIDVGSAIDATGRGYSGGSVNFGLTLGGINGSQTGTGGSYGGKGGGYQGRDSGLIYGDPRNPIFLGSGGGYWGGHGGNGGGKITINASNSLVVDGTIIADGNLGAGAATGDGSGGSVLLFSSTLAGTGTISASGGHTSNWTTGGGTSGGGGRVAIYCDTLDPTDNFNNLRGVSALAGKDGYDDAHSSAGTVYFKYNQGTEELFIDGNVVNGTAPGATPLPHIGSGAAAAVSSDSLTVDGNVPLLPNGLAGLRLNPDTTQQETFAIKGNTANAISVVTPNENGIDFLNYAATGRNYGGVLHYENMTFRRGGSLLLGDPLEIPGTLKVVENGLISHYAATDTFTSGLYFTTGSMIIDNTGRIDVTGRGYRGGRVNPGNDPGLTTGNTVGSPGGAGGSHGGLGGHYSGPAAPVYDSETNPIDLGGGGGNWGGFGGAGGGRVLITTGVLSFDGTIIADGAVSGGAASGSGAGGTVNITATTLNGQGTVSAKGGSASGGVGGGGGRVAIKHGGLLGLAGISVFGGTGQYGSGANGTVYLEQR